MRDRTPARKRVLMTVDAAGGSWVYALELARSLARWNVTVTLATMGAPLTRHQRQEARQVGNLEAVFESAFKVESTDDPWDDVSRAGRWLLELEERLRPSLVHLNTCAHGALPWNSAALVAVHSCPLSRWAVLKGGAAPPAFERYRQEVRRGLRAADLVLAPSKAMLVALQQQYGPLPAARVVSYARDPSLFAPSAKEDVVLTVGRLDDDGRNLAALARVAADLPWPVCVAGEERAARPDGVRLLGRLSPERLAGWFARAAIYAEPARWQPFGLCALEAGLAGCALVLGDIPSLREVWGPAALFVPPDDAQALARALQRLIADAPARREWGRRARARALTFSPKRMAAGHLTAYAEAIMHRAALAESSEVLQ